MSDASQGGKNAGIIESLKYCNIPRLYSSGACRHRLRYGAPSGVLGRDGVSADLSAVALAEAEALARKPTFRRLTQAPSYGVCQTTETRVSGFACFVEQRSCPKLFSFRSRAGYPLWSAFALGSHLSKLQWDKAASYPACQFLTAHDARYASLQEERARPIYKRAQGPKGASGRAPLQSPRRSKSVCP